MSAELFNRKTYSICLMLTPGYSEISLIMMREALRQANEFIQGEEYHCLLISASNEIIEQRYDVIGISEVATDQIFKVVVVLGGSKVTTISTTAENHFLSRQYRLGAWLAGIESGVYHLAKLGVLKNKPASCHVNHLKDLSDLYPNIEFNTNIFSFTKAIYTCAGGLATVDMVLDVIERITPSASENLYTKLAINQPRSGSSPQKNLVQYRSGRLGKRLADAIELMESNVDEILKIQDIANYSGISKRQLQRLFQKNFSESPTTYYMQIRLKLARNKILNTSNSVIDVALSCGFVAPTHFSRCYKALYGISPQQDRQSISRLQ